MSSPVDENELEPTLAEAYGPPPEADFETWRRRHAQAVACLTPQQMTALARRRRMRSRSVKFALIALVLAGVCLGVSYFAGQGDRSAVLAHAWEQIDQAETITWKTTFYMRVTSKDGKRSWIRTNTRQCAYKAPGLYRKADLDDKGKITWVEIEDVIHGKKLRLDYDEKMATLHLSEGRPQDGGPLY